MFKTPVWTFELIRDTNAPFERVVELLMDGPGYARWHPRYRSAAPRIVAQDAERVEIEHEASPCPGVTERCRYLVQRQGERVLLVHVGRFKGWLVPLFLGWWRLESRDLWERFVRCL